MRQGDRAESFFIIDRGECIVEVDGHEVSRMSAGTSFGENALLRDLTRTATIKAVSSVKCLTMTRQTFTDLIEDRQCRERMVRGAKLFETLTDDKVAKLGSALERVRSGNFKSQDSDSCSVLQFSLVAEIWSLAESKQQHCQLHRIDSMSAYAIPRNVFEVESR